MKIVSLNVRGLGGRVKRRELRKFVKRENLDLMCIQETKMEVISPEICSSLWDYTDFGWNYLPSIGRAGGILCVWRNKSFKVNQLFGGSNFIGMKGCWGLDFECSFVFVYAPCDAAGKRQLWADIIEKMAEMGGENWCVVGDFNEVKCSAERRGLGSTFHTTEMVDFQKFIDEADLVDLPMVGRKFTWYRPNGTAMSRLDRFLLSEGWLARWRNLSQWGLARSFSDHCPVLLKIGQKDWGPTPFRVWDDWNKEPGFDCFVKDRWASYKVTGKASFILKEKLKLLKADLKKWNK